MLQEMLNALIRHALTGAAGVLVAHGYATNDQATQLVGGAIAALGIYMTYQHKQKMLAAQSAQSAPAPQGNSQ